MDMLVWAMLDTDMLDILMLVLAMPVWAMLMLDMLDILMLLDMLPTAPLPAPILLVLLPLLSQLLLEDMPVPAVILLTLPELFMLPKIPKFEIFNLGISPFLNKFPISIKKKKKN